MCTKCFTARIYVVKFPPVIQTDLRICIIRVAGLILSSLLWTSNELPNYLHVSFLMLEEGGTKLCWMSFPALRIDDLLQ